MWREADAPDGALPVLAELRDGLNSAYRQLRELLTTFRLKMAGRRFGEPEPALPCCSLLQ